MNGLRLDELMRAWLVTLSRSEDAGVSAMASSALELQDALASSPPMSERTAAATRYVSLVETLMSSAARQSRTASDHREREGSPVDALTSGDLERFWSQALENLKGHFEADNLRRPRDELRVADEATLTQQRSRDPALKRMHMSGSQILRGKHAVIFGAGGSVGAAIAMELASEGAEVFLSGRSPANVEEVARHITGAGGRAQSAVVDASDEKAVARYFEQIAESRSVDIVYNAVGPLAGDYGNGKAAVDLGVDEFFVPLATIVKPSFVTAREAARRMVKQRSGVILFLTGSPARAHVHGATAIGTAFGAIETFSRNLAFELGASGVRVVCLRTAAMPDTRTIQHTREAMARGLNVPMDRTGEMLANMTMLKVSPRTSDTAMALAFLASDRARMVTGTVVNGSAGAVAD